MGVAKKASATATKMRKKAAAYHHGDLRAALISAARKKLEDTGVEGLSLKALATSLKVSQSAPYRHFRSKDELLAGVAIEGFQTFRADTSAAFSKQEPYSALENACRAYLTFSRKHPQLYRLIFASSLLHDQAENADLQKQARLAFDQLLSMVSSATSHKSPARATWVWITIHGIAMLELSGLSLGPRSEDLGADDVITQMVSTLSI